MSKTRDPLKQIQPKVKYLILFLAFMLSACAGNEERKVDPNDIFVQSKLDIDHELEYRKKKAAEPKAQPPKLTLKQRMPKAAQTDQVPSWIEKRKYRLRARNLSVRQALKMFAKNYKLNIYYEPEISGKVSVDFRNLPLKKAMEIILGAHGYYWEWQDNLIYVGKYRTKVFTIDYLRLKRTGKGASTVSIAATASGQNSTRTEASISQGDDIHFWDELEKQLLGLKSQEGRITINRTSGTIQITDTNVRVKEIEKFLIDIKKALHRQVLIEARIVEVELTDDNRLGVDWGEMSFLNFTGVTNTLSNLAQNTIDLKTATASLSYNDGRFVSMIEALSQQGKVKVMSQPRIRTLNNQPAIIKVGTDRTFFATSVNSTSTGNSTMVTTSELARTVTEGVVLSITPQISADGNIILDVSPVITRIKDIITSQYGSTAPVLDIKQANTLVRAVNGEMIVVGGLIQDSRIERASRVPVLGSIPLVGKLFKSTSESNHRTELVIFLVPKIIG